MVIVLDFVKVKVNVIVNVPYSHPQENFLIFSFPTKKIMVQGVHV